MVKYELLKDHIEMAYRDRRKIEPGIVLISDNLTPELIKSFDNEEDALEELRQYESSIIECTSGTRYIVVEEYWVEECIYDDKDEGGRLSGGDICGISKMKIELVEESLNDIEILAVFDNMAEAIYAEYDYNCDYDGENEVYLRY